ncbi:prolyl oligopeptidase family serine peptidase [Candidatus Roizmanbacteria bacterium]|nr:prolyl oligopeptidase family serine peptidase [Candidatus Roizmanbacteria bacterium]
MKWASGLLAVTGVLVGSGIMYGFLTSRTHRRVPVIIQLQPSVSPTPTPSLFEKYRFEQLQKTTFAESEIVFDDLEKEEADFTSYLFHYTVFDKKVTGRVTIPVNNGSYPIIIMFRGYVDRESYTPGVGTRHAGDVLAKNGFITLAPDFLGYGGSDMPSAIVLEERFQTYTTALTLLASVAKITSGLHDVGLSGITADEKNVGIWGHSNGGHIALVTLEVTGTSYPTTLWAPVSKPFPYSILYYTDEYEDHGKMLRRVVAEFEETDDVELYSLTNYFDWIDAPIILHQGSADEAVSIAWSSELNNALTGLEKDVTYYTYPGDDHNFAQRSWDTVVMRDIAFFKKHLQNQ